MVSYSRFSGARSYSYDTQIWIGVQRLIYRDKKLEILDRKEPRDFLARRIFDHRLRDADSLSRKYEYILVNPVRAGLAESSSDWKWKIVPED